MKREVVLATVVLLAVVSLAQGQQGELHGSVGATFDTRYVWRGITVFGSKAGMHPFVDLDLFGTGFGLNVTGHIPIGSNSAGGALGAPPFNMGLQEFERWDYTLNYKGMLMPEDMWETRYMLGYRYFNYPDASAHAAFEAPASIGSYDLQEAFAGASWPNVLGVPRLVPSYVVLKGWPSNGSTLVGSSNPNGGTYSGWAHVLMLDYDFPIAGLVPEIPEHIIKLHGEIIFNDQIDPRPGGPMTDSNWTHYVLGASTDFDLGAGVTVTPAIYYQHTMEERINADEDILWSGVTLAYKF